jgi:hypothetical protein
MQSSLVPLLAKSLTKQQHPQSKSDLQICRKSSGNAAQSRSLHGTNESVKTHEEDEEEKAQPQKSNGQIKVSRCLTN